MNGFNFTERVRKCLALAREEAVALHHEYVGTEHILLGIIHEGEGVAAATMQNLGVDLEQLERAIKEAVKQGKETQPTGHDLPYTSRAKRTLELSMSAARDLNHSYVGTEHLLLGLIREEKGIAAQILAQFGATAQPVRDETVRLLGTPDGAAHASRIDAAAPLESRVHTNFVSPIASIAMQIRLENGHVVREQFLSAMEAIAYLSRRSA